MSQLQLLSVESPTVSLYDGRPAVDSLQIAKFFTKRHTDVLRDISRLAANCPETFSKRNFASAEYYDEQGKQRPMFQLYRDGFMLLVMGYTGKKALALKLAYIEAFNSMEHALTGQHPSQNMSELPITPDQQCTLQTLVKSRIEAIPAERRPKGAYPQVWSRFNNHFRLGSYKQLPQARMSEAIEYLMNMTIAQQELPTGDTNTLPQVSGNAFTIPDNTQQAKDFNKILNDVNVLAHKIGQTMLEVGVVANAGGRSSLLPPALNARYNTLDQMHKAAMASLYTAEHMLYCIYYMGKEAQFA